MPGLEQLYRWGVVTKWPEPARTGEDFLRRRDRYQLTPSAARLHTFWIQQDGDDAAAAADLTLAPRAIPDRLEAFAAAVAERSFPAAASEYQQVSAVHQAMAEAARSWQRALTHALSGSPDPEKQEVLLRTLQAYVRMWGEQVDTNSPRISVLLETMSETLTERVWRACARAATDHHGEPDRTPPTIAWRSTRMVSIPGVITPTRATSTTLAQGRAWRTDRDSFWAERPVTVRSRLRPDKWYIAVITRRPTMSSHDRRGDAMDYRIVEMELPNGSTVLVRAADLDGGTGATKTGWSDKFEYGDLAATLEGLSSAIRSALANAAPEKVSVALGIELAVKSGALTALLVEGEGKGSLSVTLEWGGDRGD